MTLQPIVASEELTDAPANPFGVSTMRKTGFIAVSSSYQHKLEVARRTP